MIGMEPNTDVVSFPPFYGKHLIAQFHTYNLSYTLFNNMPLKLCPSL